ncbi:GNAT family N-acetyltransferase [Streptomyces sp. NBC_01077]|uniref:GNAT family N-acetyltransferase n=1 Tax=Streptomyces sp. NBC_01077 TaxID=2903746 RepID=UPI00386AF5B8|nr:GNAT family N-acetyltransferase [Streptomyces sp. NBC_01077]
MSVDPLLVRARGLWEALAGVPVSFAPSGGVTVVVSPGSQLCPPSWTGIVVLGDAAIVTAPTEVAARAVSRSLASVPADSLTRGDVVRAVLPVTEVLGPAALGYVSSDDFRPSAAVGAIEHLDPGHQDLRGLVGSAGPEDRDESGLEEITSPAFVVRDGTDVIAAAGYRTWPESTAHVSVLTAPRHRGRGLARQVASAAVAHALAAGLMPQWRARPVASRRVASALGFRELGSQLSLGLDHNKLRQDAVGAADGTAVPGSRA